MTGAELILEERKRQIEVEGFTIEHDMSDHEVGDLVTAASCYLNPLRFLSWPFDKKSWKPKNIVRDLVRAGALIAAALDLYKEKHPKKFEEFLNA